MTERYQYKECGLDYVYLSNGFTVEETPYGPGVTIADADRLHDAIALDVICSPHALRGQEVRYLRSMLDISQAALGDLLGKSRATIARWEAAPHAPIPGGDDRALRFVYALRAERHEAVMTVLDLLQRIDDLAHEGVEFEDTEAGWMRKAA